MWRRKKWETFFYMCAAFYKTNRCNGIVKNIVGCNLFIPTHAPKPIDIKIINCMCTLTRRKNVQL